MSGNFYRAKLTGFFEGPGVLAWNSADSRRGFGKGIGAKGWLSTPGPFGCFLPTMNATRILDELARTGVALLLREPFYAHLFGSLNKEVVGAGHPVDSMAVGAGQGGLVLYVNAKFWDEELRDPAHRYGVVKHEMLHLVFRHLLVQEPQLDALLLNIAFDLVVNQYVDRAQLPDDSIFLESFPDLRLPPGQTWFYYYKKMEDLRQGQGGEFAGTPSSDQLQKIRSDSHGLERHQPWREMRSRSELEKSVTDQHLDSLLRTAHQRTSAHAWGSLPGELREMLRQRLQPLPAEVDWRTMLRLFSGSAFKTRLENTLKRPSKRYGTSPGIKLRRRQKLMVALDTSGSIGTVELELFFREIYHLWRAGTAVEILECDTRVHRRYPYRGRLPEAVQGRGGTDFREPLELANRERPDGLVYFTDGFAPPPALRMHVPVLWVLTRGGLEKSHATYKELPGRKVKLA
jgi:predicted metal-dependent peptidase